MQNALALLEQRAHAGTWSLDIATNALWWSEGTHRIHGTDSHSYTPRLDASEDMLVGSDRGLLKTALETAIRERKDYGVRVRLRRPDGVVLSVFAAGRPNFRDGILTGVSGVLYNLDAIEKERSTAALKEERFKMLLRDSPSGLILVSMEKRITLVNPALCSMLGYSEAELLTKTMKDITHLDDHESSGEASRRLLTGTMDNVSFETRYVKKDNSTIWVRISLSLLRGQDRTPLHYVGQCLDISESKSREEALFEAKELAQITLSSIADGVVRTNERGIITLCNEAAARMLGANGNAIIGKKFEEMIVVYRNGFQDILENPIADTLKTGLAIKTPTFTHIRMPDGSTRPIFNSTAPVRNRSHEIVGAVFVFQDATENLSMAERLRFQATHDLLTGLPNRQAAEEQIRRAMENASTEGESYNCFLFYMDLDHFKVINDSCGHHAGDEVIKEIAFLISKKLRDSDFLARIGGDEFILLVSNITKSGAVALAERIAEAIGNYRYVFGSTSYLVSISIGIAELERDSHIQDILAQADAACYAAKRSGRGCYQIFAPEDALISENHGDLAWLQKIRTALDECRSPNDGHFQLYFQAIVDTNGSLLGSEALIRFISSDGQVASPEGFLPAAERMGLLSLIDRWVCIQAIAILNRMIQSQPVREEIGDFISVNVSARTLGIASFCEDLLTLLGAHPEVANRLRIEITETERGRWGHEELLLLQKIREHEVLLILDDFGSGYNSFRFLKVLKVDGIKLDQNVVGGLDKDPVDRNLASAAVAIASELGIFITAEGVEDQESFNRLKVLGVSHFQGYLFQKPHSLEAR